jgi:hypothetical protein
MADDLPADVPRARLTAQLLAGPPAEGPDQVVGHLLAVQAQDPRGARLAVRARSTATTGAEVDAALADRRLVVTTLNRGTLHLVRSEDYRWLQLLTTPPLLTGSARRLQQEGVSPAAAERGVAAVVRAVEDGPQTRGQLREVLVRADVPVAGQAFVHVLGLAALRGHVVRGPMVDGGQAFVLVEDWLGPAAAVDRDEALAVLARRYLTGHGPAADRDLAVWAGLPLRDVRCGLSAIAAELVQRPDGLVDLRGRPAPGPLPGPRLLGPFDPVLHGWASREWVVGQHRSLVTSGGVFRPFAMVDGRAVATWGRARGRVTLTPLEPLDPAVQQALSQDAGRVEAYLG